MASTTKDLNKCKCGKIPQLERGEDLNTKKPIWDCYCDNPTCTHKPSTGPSGTRRAAIKAWNKKLVSYSLF